MRSLTILLVVPAVLAFASAAHAQDPKFEYGKPEEVKAAEWKASAQLGMLFTTGNSRSLTFSGGANVSYKQQANKFMAEVNGALVRNEIRVATDLNNNMVIDEGEISRQSSNAAKNILAKLRYDRFFGEKNSLYATARAGFDEPAGKKIFASGQVGYSRVLYKSEMHELVGEAGYDLGYEGYVAEDTKGVTIHSLRLFVGYTGKLSEVTGLAVNVETFSNLNEETVPQGTASPFEDTRGIAKAELTTKLMEKLSLRVTVKSLFDNVPAPLPKFSVPFAMGYLPLAEKTDFVTELALILNIL